MKKLITPILLAVSTLGSWGLTLVDDGAPRATIVVSSSALNPGKDDAAAQKISVAAHDLQDYIKKMSGALLPLVGEDAKPSGVLILVGASHLTDEMKLSLPSGLTTERREEGFLIQSTGDRLVLAGNDAGPYHGTEYATYELLNHLGVRWYMPGDFGEVVPARRTIVVAEMEVREKPDFIQRNWWFNTADEMVPLDRRWKIRNKMNPDNMFFVPTDGSVADFMPAPEEAKVHPELFALNFDGTVNNTLPNLSNPDTVKIAAEKAKAYFRAHPDANSVGMSPADGLPRDFTPETVKLNQGFSQLGGREGVPDEMAASEEWFAWVCAVMREVNKEFPDRIITTNGYANRTEVPVGVKIDPHLSIMFASIWSDTLHALDNPKSWQTVRQGQLLREWASVNNKVWVYNYDYIMLVSALTPVPGTHKLAHDFPLMKKWGVAGFDNESRNVWAERGIATRYLQARLMWNADLNVADVLDDFYHQWYGAAAQPAHAFWEALEDAMENTPLQGHEDRFLPWVYTPQLLDQLGKEIASAEALAATTTEKIHVRVDRLIFEHLRAYMAMSQADLTGDYAEAARQGERMMALRGALSSISPFFISARETLPNGELDVYTGVNYWGVTNRINYYKTLVEKMSNKTGSLVALLPQRAAFSLDPEDEGRAAGWWHADWDTHDWASATTAEPFYMQGPSDHPYMNDRGYPYLGAMWYQFKIELPAQKAGQAVRLYVPTIETQAWLWVNGQYIGNRPYNEAYVRPNDMDVDVTGALRPGTNVITFRVSTSQNNAACASGLLSRLFLYSPIEASKTPPSVPSENLVAWFDANKGVTADAGGAVSTWADQSPQHNNATQTTVAAQPKLVPNAANGNAAIAFNGSTTYLNLLHQLDLTSGMSIFIVAKNDVRKDFNGIFQIGSASGNPFDPNFCFQIYWQAGTKDTGSGNLMTVFNPKVQNAYWSGNDLTPSVKSYYLYNYNCGQGKSEMLVDDQPEGTFSGSSQLPLNSGYGTLGVINSSLGAAGVLKGAIAEVLIYSHALSEGDHHALYNYLNQKYQLKK